MSNLLTRLLSSADPAGISASGTPFALAWTGDFELAMLLPDMLINRDIDREHLSRTLFMFLLEFHDFRGCLRKDGKARGWVTRLEGEECRNYVRQTP